MKPNFNAVKKELWSVVTERVLTGVHGPLPKGVIPVPCLNTNGGIPPKWKVAFKRYKAKGTLDDWHTFISQESGGSLSMIADEWPELGSELKTKVREFSYTVNQFLNTCGAHARIAGDATPHFRIVFSWLLRGKPTGEYLASLLYRSYYAGGAPCGWLGRYPKGRLILYWPHKQEPEFK